MANKIRLHIFGLPHTITSNEYSHCAFTGKVLRFGSMMLSRDFEVYHYGIETSEIVCTKHFDVLTKNEWNDLRIKSIKFLNPELDEKKIPEILKNKKKFVGDLGNSSTPLYQEFNSKLRPLIIQNYRSKSTDIICLPFGYAHDQALTGLDFLCVESGIGYEGSYRDFRIFESYAILHQTLKSEKKGCQHYWFVVPNYYNVIEWPLSLNPDYKTVGFFGRICDIKGCNIIIEIAKRMPWINFILCGQGDPDKYLLYPNIQYKEPIEGLERGEYLSGLTVLLAPTTYVEPFCGVNVEAQLCGTPVITNECGAFVETIENFKTGLLAHTLEDFCYGINLASNGYFDRKYIRSRAIKLYDMYNVALRYEYVFKTLIDVYNGNNGWYSSQTWMNQLELYYNPNYNNNNDLIPWYYFYTPDYELWHQKLLSTLSEYFDVNPIRVDSIPNLNNIHNIHHWVGCSFKLELLINTIKSNLGKRIVFTDVTWYINPLKIKELFEIIKNSSYGMSFCNNNGNGDLNIGICCIDCNNNTLKIWEDILEKFNENPNSHDQTIVSKQISNPNLFDESKIVARWPELKSIWDITYAQTYLMLKIFTPSNTDKKTRDTHRNKFMKEYFGFSNEL